MTSDEVRKRIESSARGYLDVVSHGIPLREAMESPREIPVIDRRVRDGKIEDTLISVWLVARKRQAGGCMIVFDDQSGWFGLAYEGFSSDKHPIMSGWYKGGLLEAFLGM